VAVLDLNIQARHQVVMVVQVVAVDLPMLLHL
jgi:hypothetical protein